MDILYISNILSMTSSVGSLLGCPILKEDFRKPTGDIIKRGDMKKVHSMVQPYNRNNWKNRSHHPTSEVKRFGIVFCVEKPIRGCGENFDRTRTPHSAPHLNRTRTAGSAINHNEKLFRNIELSGVSLCIMVI